MGEQHRGQPVTETQTNREDTLVFGDIRYSPILYKTTSDDNLFSTSRTDFS